MYACVTYIAVFCHIVDIDTSGHVGSPAGTWDMVVLLQLKLDAVIRSRIGPRRMFRTVVIAKGRRISHPHDLRRASAGRCAACRATTCAAGLYVLLLAHRIDPAWPAGVTRRESVATGIQSRTRTTSQAHAVYFSPTGYRMEVTKQKLHFLSRDRCRPCDQNVPTCPPELSGGRHSSELRPRRPKPANSRNHPARQQNVLVGRLVTTRL
jgi:hypothetical protein